MDINEVGLTAFVISYFRMLERERRHPLFEDPYAEWFVPEEMKEKARQFHEVLPEAGDMIRYRVCFFNDITKRAIRDGKKQIVLVGSGFDMRPVIFRTEGVTFYDVDQPAVLQYKHEVLAQHGVQPCPGMPCNYLEINLPEQLASVGFDPAKPTLFLWEGNTMYLPLELIYGFLRQLQQQVESFHIGFDYLTKKVINRTSGIEGVTRAADFFEHKLGAPWITGFDDLGVFERNTGLAVIESGGMENVGVQYAPEDAKNIAQFTDLYSYCVLAK